jgi:hypothetical protein
MTFPTPNTVALHVRSGVGEDDHGNEIDVYTPPLDEPGTPHQVIGWSTPSSTEPLLAGHDRVVVDVELLAPPGFPAKPHDVIDLPDSPAGRFEVVGEVRDFTRGPFGFTPGGVLNLRRVEG